MDNYEYMAIGRKLCKVDDRNNLATGLFITTLVLGGCVYIQYRMIQKQNQQIKTIMQGMENLSQQFLRQKRENDNLKRENIEQRQINQALSRQLEENVNKQV